MSLATDTMSNVANAFPPRPRQVRSARRDFQEAQAACRADGIAQRERGRAAQTASDQQDVDPVVASRPLGSIDRFKEIDRRSVQNARLLHRFFKISRRGKVLSLLRVLSVEDDNNLALVAIGGMIDPWICEARRSLHFDMPIEDRTPLAVIPHFVTDIHHSHGILPLLPAEPILYCVCGT